MAAQINWESLGGARVPCVFLINILNRCDLFKTLRQYMEVWCGLRDSAIRPDRSIEYGLHFSSAKLLSLYKWRRFSPFVFTGNQNCLSSAYDMRPFLNDLHIKKVRRSFFSCFVIFSTTCWAGRNLRMLIVIAFNVKFFLILRKQKPCLIS